MEAAGALGAAAPILGSIPNPPWGTGWSWVGCGCHTHLSSVISWKEKMSKQNDFSDFF